MTIRVLVVDDSGFFRRRLTDILNSDPMIEVVDSAADGQEALQKVQSCRPDVVTMDIEMPVMNGIDATREIMKRRPMPILMFSSLTYDGAQATLDALEAGATDFLPKRFDDISNDREEAKAILCKRIKTLARGHMGSPTPAAGSLRQTTASPGATARPVPSRPLARAGRAFNPRDYDLVAIGTSTGGPVALQEVLTQLPASFPLPIVLIQHMPAKFTEAFANRLNQLCQIGIREAKHGDVLQPGTALLAPGGLQMRVQRRGNLMQVRVDEETDPLQNYKPCVDVTFGSLADLPGTRVLGIILTGMGADGKVGCERLKTRGATIWTQDEQTSTIYGMPAAAAPLAEQILPLKEIGKKLALNA
jgi:two-component system chemotaxis response regulator CheB